MIEDKEHPQQLQKHNFEMPKGRALVWKIFQIFVCECVGAGIICFPAFLLPPATLTPDFASPLICGCAVYLGIWIVGPTSGGQMNPILTLASAITRRLPLLYIPVYLVAQLCGSLVSMAIAYRLNTSLSTLPSTYGLTLPSADASIGNALGMEIIITMVLVLTYLATLDEIRDAVWQMKNCNNFPIAMLLAVVFCVAAGGPISGGSMNPWRSLSAAIIQNHYDHVWIYIVGPSIGSVCACILYELIICENVSLQRTKRWFTAKHFDRSVKHDEF
ncbi:unnamed protein product [Rodentolepis nana]|uniref:Aquaporin n=1 Tax=Rodentolepis nana TaxID=102285 RepID=A0A0R3T565_RODNA|nr:unnamed protein product [Rodentolepis nana]